MAADERKVTVVVASDPVRPLEIVELKSFEKEADELLSREELEQLRQELAVLRQLGTVISGTGGLRKFRWGAKGKGKRGGVRVLYYYGGDHMPIFLIAIYAKNEKVDMTPAEKKAATKLVAALNLEYRHKRSTPQFRVVLGSGRRR